MARELKINGRVVTGSISIVVGKPIVLSLLLCLDGEDDAIGDKWSATASGGLTFTPTEVEIPVGAQSLVSMDMKATSGFSQPGDHKVFIHKTEGKSANRLVPAMTIDCQVTATPTQPVVLPAQPVAQLQPAPPATPTATIPAASIPQPFQVQMVSGAPPATRPAGRSQRTNGQSAVSRTANTNASPPASGGLIRWISITAIALSVIVFCSLTVLVWQLVNIMQLSNASYTAPAPEKSDQSSE